MSAIKKTRIFAVLLGSGLLGYGVMVTLQILVLPFLVRVRVAQQRERRMTVHSSFLCHSASSIRKNSIFVKTI